MIRGTVLALLVTAVPAAAQVRDPPPPATGEAGVLRGTVVAADTGRPVAQAHVAVSATSGSPRGFGALTDLSGRFDFAVPEGAYTVSASKHGAFLATHVGQTHPGLPGKTVAVRAGEETTIEIAMLRPAVIAGRVVDEAGDPLPNATIVALRQQSGAADLGSPGFVVRAGTRLRFDTREARDTTDDRGAFRLFGLEPGEYLLMGLTPTPSRPETRGDLRRPAAIYFPGVADPAAATRFQLAPGQEIANADFVLRFVPTLRVSGMAVGPDGVPLAGGSISLHVQGVEGLAGLSQVATIRPDGAFVFDALPGQYLLRARHQIRGAPESSRYRGHLSLAARLTVTDRDISGLFLELTYGAALRGRMIFEGAPMPADTAHRFQVQIESGAPGAVLSARPSADGTFELRGLEAGARRLTTSAPPGWVLKGVFMNGRDVAERWIEFRDGVAIEDVSVVFTTVTSPLTIAVAHARGSVSAAVAVFPQDPALWHARSPRILFRPAGETPVILEWLPPGDYFVAAIADVAARTLSAGDRPLLERLRAIAEPVRLVEGVTTPVRVTAVPLPQ